MTSAALHFFSGTGNTYRAVKIIEGKLKDAGYSVDLFRVASSSAAPAKKYDLSIFAFPVYALDIPHIMAGYMKRMPHGGGAKAAVVTSYGNWDPETLPGDAGCCLTRAEGILRRRGYDVFYTDTVGYPVNWTALLNTPPPEYNEATRRKGDLKAEAIADHIIAGDRAVKRGRFVIDHASRAFGALFSLFGRQSIGLMYMADSRCNGCGLCSRSCPTAAISMRNDRPDWNLQCEGCQRCINGCPRAAIQTSLAKLYIVLAVELIPVLTLILIFYLPYEALPGLAAGPVSLGSATYGPVLAFILWLAITVVFTVPATYWLIRLIGLIPGAKMLFKANVTHRYRRYLDPGFSAIETVKK